MKMIIMVECSKMGMSKNHMSTLILIIMTCLLVSMTSSMLYMNHWMNLMVIMVYISGIMVLFMYIASLAPNEKSANKKTPFFVLGMMTPIMYMKAPMKTNQFFMGTSYMVNMWSLVIMVLLILLSSQIPPKMMMMLYKGMKTSK